MCMCICTLIKGKKIKESGISASGGNWEIKLSHAPRGFHQSSPGLNCLLLVLTSDSSDWGLMSKRSHLRHSYLPRSLP